MKALVLYDSVFGNTQKVAEAIASALAARAQVELAKASHQPLPKLADIDLLVVESPTRGFRPTEDVAAFLKSIPRKGLAAKSVAAFDTRFKADEVKSAMTRFVVKTGGYAAKRIASTLTKAGGALAAPPEGFYVEDIEGPLKAGELNRAAAWASSLLAPPQASLGA
jgi:menaquinone-dependent protoporphyrinogen IX oxidase